MSPIEQKLFDFPSDYLTTIDLYHLIPGSDDARYAQVKRAVRKGALIRLRQGLYKKAGHFEKRKPHPFEMSNLMVWPSYVSLESALSYHGLIPEAVYTTTAVTPNRAISFMNYYGRFTFRTLPNFLFLVDVTRIVDNDYIYLVANPWKALTDYVYCYKKNWEDMTPLVGSLRIDLEDLAPLNKDLSHELSNYYRSKRIDRFLKGMIRHYDGY